LITPFDVVVFASEVFYAVVVDDFGYGVACGSNIVPAKKAYPIDERGCLGVFLDILALSRPIMIEGAQVLI
jgi:hypothetical protein